MTSIFAASSPFNTPLPANAPLHPNSLAMIQSLNFQVQNEINKPGGTTPGIGTLNVYFRDSTFVTKPVNLSNPTVSWRQSLASVLAYGVPLPPSVAGGGGSDNDLAIVDVNGNHYWDLYQFSTAPDGSFQCNWGGAANQASFGGVFDESSYPGFSQANWGATACSLALAGGVMLISELNAGVIPHALGIVVPYAGANPQFVKPAQRGDGDSPDPYGLPEGLRLRLDPTVNVAALNLPWMAGVMAQAAQTYGIFITNQTHVGTGFLAQSAQSAGVPDPYYGPTGFLRGMTTRQVASAFPWQYIQVVAPV